MHPYAAADSAIGAAASAAVWLIGQLRSEMERARLECSPRGFQHGGGGRHVIQGAVTRSMVCFSSKSRRPRRQTADVEPGRLVMIMTNGNLLGRRNQIRRTTTGILGLGCRTRQANITVLNSRTPVTSCWRHAATRTESTRARPLFSGLSKCFFSESAHWWKVIISAQSNTIPFRLAFKIHILRPSQYLFLHCILLVGCTCGTHVFEE